MPDPSLAFTTIHRGRGGMETSRKEFILGRNTRSEHRDCSGQIDASQPNGVRYEYGPRRAVIQNREIDYLFELDLDAHLFTAARMNEYGSPAWIEPRRLPARKPSGRTIHVHAETTGTGERQEMFGHAARRVLTRTARKSSSESDRNTGETHSDGWYIDPPPAWQLAQPRRPGSVCVLSSPGPNGERDDFKFTFTGERETGFPLLLTTTHRGSFNAQETVEHMQVAEFSEAPLDPRLFLPPADFRRVPQLPGALPHGIAHKFRLQWELLKDRLAHAHTF